MLSHKLGLLTDGARGKERTRGERSAMSVKGFNLSHGRKKKEKERKKAKKQNRKREAGMERRLGKKQNNNKTEENEILRM